MRGRKTVAFILKVEAFGNRKSESDKKSKLRDFQQDLALNNLTKVRLKISGKTAYRHIDTNLYDAVSTLYNKIAM